MMVLNPDDKGKSIVKPNGELPESHRVSSGFKSLHAPNRLRAGRCVAGLNQADSSLYYLKKAADGGYLYHDTNGMPPFKPYPSQPVYKAIMRQFKLP